MAALRRLAVALLLAQSFIVAAHAEDADDFHGSACAYCILAQLDVDSAPALVSAISRQTVPACRLAERPAERPVARPVRTLRSRGPPDA